MEFVPDDPNLAAFMVPLRELIEEHVERGHIHGVTVLVLAIGRSFARTPARRAQAQLAARLMGSQTLLHGAL